MRILRSRGSSSSGEGPIKKAIARSQHLPTVHHMTDDNLHLCPGPPTNRLWTVDDVAAYLGIRGIDELIRRNPDFPEPLNLSVRGRRWLPSQIIGWTEAIADGTLEASRSAHASRPVKTLDGAEWMASRAKGAERSA